MTIAELHLLLEHCAPHRRLLYEVAACSGLRENELRQLTPAHLDRKGCFIRIEKEWDKGRKDRTQFISRTLMDRLVAFAESGEAKRLYAKAIEQQGKRRAMKAVPENALLYVPRNCCAMLKTDLEKAEVPVLTEKGKLDFHALRTAYINFMLQSKADPKTVQTLARHATFDMTLNVYGRAEEDLCREAAEAVGRMVFPGDSGHNLDVSGHAEAESGYGNYTKLTQEPKKLSAEKTAIHSQGMDCSEVALERSKRSDIHRKPFYIRY